MTAGSLLHPRGAAGSRLAAPHPLCGLCHDEGDLVVLVIVGVGPRPLHVPCVERLRNMGFEITPERRKGAR